MTALTRYYIGDCELAVTFRGGPGKHTDGAIPAAGVVGPFARAVDSRAIDGIGNRCRLARAVAGRSGHPPAVGSSTMLVPVEQGLAMPQLRHDYLGICNGPWKDRAGLASPSVRHCVAGGRGGAGDRGAGGTDDESSPAWPTSAGPVVGLAWLGRPAGRLGIEGRRRVLARRLSFALVVAFALPLYYQQTRLEGIP